MRVGVLAYDGCWAMGVFSVTDFFRVVSLLDRHLGVDTCTAVHIVSVDGAPVMAASGHVITPDGLACDTLAYDLVVVPAIEGPRVTQQTGQDAGIVAWLAARIKEGTRVLALTTAARWLAATGLVDHVLLATHWAFIRPLKKQYPHCQFVSHKSFLHTERIYTTGSLSGGFDALLEIISQTHGDRFSQLCATHLLMSDPQKLNPILPGHRNHTDDVILRAQDWIESHYSEAITIRDIAKSVGMTERTLKRRFLQFTQLNPNLYLQRVRIDKAKKLLIATSLTIKEIAYEVGYENVSFFIRLFKQATGHTPAQWKAGNTSQVMAR